MNKTELVASVAEKTAMTKKDAEKALNAVFASIEEALAKGCGLSNAIPDQGKIEEVKSQTQTKIAGQMGISQVQVSRMEKRILKKMREEFGLD